MASTEADYEIAFYRRETGNNNTASLPGLKRQYLNLRLGLSGQSAQVTSLADKELAYLRSKTGLTTGSLADCRAAYYAAVIPAGEGGGQQALYDYFRLAPSGN